MADKMPAEGQEVQKVKGIESDEQGLGTSAGVLEASSSAKPLKRGLNGCHDERDSKRRKGTAPIKEEFLMHHGGSESTTNQGARNDDNAEASHHVDRQPSDNNTTRQKSRGQNKNRKFEPVAEEVGLCPSRSTFSEFSPELCSFGSKCRFEHDLRKYLEAKADNLSTFDGLCPAYEDTGSCQFGWKCRFIASHSEEVLCEDERLEWRLKTQVLPAGVAPSYTSNNIDTEERIKLTRKKFPTPKSDKYLRDLEEFAERTQHDRSGVQAANNQDRNSSSPEPENGFADANAPVSPHKLETRSAYVESPFLPSEKRRLYFGPETPVLAPLTTQGNLPFRRLCVSLGASFTYSEMAMSLPLLQGHKPEWALIKAHSSEQRPPQFKSRPPNVVYDYDQSSDLRFSAQISASKVWTAVKAAEVLTTLLPNGLRTIDLNCGCPIDLVFREGAGSGLMNNPNKLSKMILGMNSVSGATPITCKIRMGTKDNHPTAQKLVERLLLGSREKGGNSSPSGVAAITLHGRSRQQRYTKEANWSYIAQTADFLKELEQSRAIRNGDVIPKPTPESDLISSITQAYHDQLDTIHAPDPRDLSPAATASNPTSPPSGPPPLFFLGNGDIYSPQHYHNHLASTSCHSLMIARGALIKPWIFSELSNPNTQDMGPTDPSSSERLEHISNFVKFGLAHWGSDARGVSTTRRFLLEHLSFTHRYVPVGLLEYLPPELNDRAPRFRARNDMEQVLASEDVRDWVKISEMYLGKMEEGFKFTPKHKSNSFEGVEGQG